MSDNGANPAFPTHYVSIPKLSDLESGAATVMTSRGGMDIRTLIAKDLTAALLQSPRVNREMTEADIAARATACTEHLLAALAKEPAQPAGDAKQPKARFYPCGCIECVCDDSDRCHGCGAVNCGQPGVICEHTPGGDPCKLSDVVSCRKVVQEECERLRGRVNDLEAKLADAVAAERDRWAKVARASMLSKPDVRDEEVRTGTAISWHHADGWNEAMEELAEKLEQNAP